MQDVTFETVPLARLKLSPLNARYGRQVPTDDLETSILGAGRLLHPLDCYREGEDVLVWDGGRRLMALQALASGKKSKLPPLLKAGIPCLVYASAETAQVNSLATFVREAMTPADEFLAIRRLDANGLAPTEIAAACNVRTPRVNQLLRLVKLAPEVIAAFEDGTIPLDVAEAFTLSEDHERQREVLKNFNPKRHSAWDVKRTFRQGSIGRDDALARFVGVKAYEAAGGRFIVDLFSNNDSADWADRELAERLGREKLDALVEKVKAEGWAWVKVDDTRPWDWDKGFERLTGKKDTFTAEQKADAGVSICIKYDGQADIVRGLRKKAKVVSAAVEKAQADPAMFGYGHGGHMHLTDVATDATRVALLRNPLAAYDGLLSHLAWTVLRSNSSYDSAASTASSLVAENGFRFVVSVDGSAEFLAALQAWRTRLPSGRVAFCEAVAALSAEDKAELLALTFATTLSAREGRFDGYDRKPTRWSHLGWMAGHAGLDVAAAWRPDAEFLKKGSKDALLAAISDMGGAEGMANAKKAELVKYATTLAADKGWTPKLLATLTEVAPEPEPVRAAPEADGGDRRMFKDALADQMRAVADDDDLVDDDEGALDGADEPVEE